MDNYNNGNNYGGGNNNNNRDNRNGNNNNKKPKNVNLIVFVIIAAVITFICITMLNSMLKNATYKEISYNQFIEMVNNDQVKKVALEQDRILITPTDDAQENNGVNKLGYTYYTGYVNDDSLVSLLKRKGIEFTGYIPDSSSSIVEFLVVYVLPFLFIYVIFAFVYRRISKGGGMMGVSRHLISCLQRWMVLIHLRVYSYLQQLTDQRFLIRLYLDQDVLTEEL